MLHVSCCTFALLLKRHSETGVECQLLSVVGLFSSTTSPIVATLCEAASLLAALERRLTLIQGPPGAWLSLGEGQA